MTPDLPDHAVWRRPLASSTAPVVQDLAAAPAALLVPVAEWDSYVRALAEGPEPERVVLVAEDPEAVAPDARAFVDAIVPDRADPIAAALRLPDAAIAAIVGEMPTAYLLKLLDGDTEPFADPRLLPADDPRVRGVARSEVEARYAFAARRSGTVDAAVPDRSEGSAAMVASLMVLGLLARGVRMVSFGPYRGPEATPSSRDAGALAEHLGAGELLPATLDGTELAFVLAEGGEALEIRSAQPLAVSVDSAKGGVWAQSGQSVAVPLRALRGAGLRLRLAVVSTGEDDAS